MAERVRGEPGVAELPLDERAERVSKAVRMEARNAEPAGRLGADVARAGRRQAVRRRRLDAALRGGLEADEEGGGWVGAPGEVLVGGVTGAMGPRVPCPLADDGEPLVASVRAVEAEDLRDAGAGGEEEEHQSAVTQLGQRVRRHLVDEALAVGVLEGFLEALRQLGQVDRHTQVSR